VGVDVTLNLSNNSCSVYFLTSPNNSLSLYIFETLLNKGDVDFLSENNNILFFCGS